MREGPHGSARSASPGELRPGAAPLVHALGWGLAYYLAGRVGLHTVLPGAPLVLVAPSSGVLVVWLSLSTRRTVVWDLVALAVAGSVLSAQLGLPTWLVFFSPVVSIVGGAVFVGLMRRITTDMAPFGGGRLDWRLADLGAFLVAALTSAMVLAVLSTASQALAGLPTGELSTFLVRWGRSSSTIVAVGSVGLLVAPSVARAFRERRLVAWTREQLAVGAPRVAEGVAVVVVSIAISLVCFVWLDHLPLTFLLFTLTGWVGVRFSPAVTAVHGLLIGAIAVGATLQGHGIFANAISDPGQQAAVAQLFVLVVSASGVALAITRRQLTVAEELADARARMLDQVLTAVHDGIAVIAADGSVPMMNRASQELLGLAAPVSEIVPTTRMELYDADGVRVSDERSPHRRALAGEQVADEDYELRGTDGRTTRYLRASAEVLPGEPSDHQDPARVLVSFHDITSDRLHVNALATFAANVAHDLRGPLTVVEAWNEVLSDAFEGGDAVTAAFGAPMTARIASATTRMRDFIQVLLDYTLARDRALALAPVDLVAIARDVADLRTQTGRDRPPLIRVVGDGTAMADPVLIRIVVDNLVANACKYVAPGVRPHILITVETTGAGMVQLCVVDNGIGIPVEERHHVFESFHRVEQDGTIEGSGLGLGICHRIIQRHGGSISVDDVPDGASVRITVPAVAAPAPPVLPPHPVASPALVDS